MENERNISIQINTAANDIFGGSIQRLFNDPQIIELSDDIKFEMFVGDVVQARISGPACEVFDMLRILKAQSGATVTRKHFHEIHKLLLSTDKVVYTVVSNSVLTRKGS